MSLDPRLPRRCLAAMVAAAVLQAVLLAWPGLPAVRPSHTDFVTLHLLLELVSVTIALLVAAVAWHAHGVGTPHGPGRGTTLVVGGFAAVALLDLVHALTYAGMPEFLGPGSTERAIFFWLMGRSVEAVTVLLLLGPWAGRLTRGQALGGGLALVALLVAWGSSGLHGFPRTFEAGTGVTSFKSRWELVICAANLLAAWLWWRRARRERDSRAYLIATASWVIGIGELAFTSYLAPSDFMNIFGHVYKVAGYGVLYAASVIVNVRRPFEAMRDAQAEAEERERQLRSLADNLPDAIVYQTAREADGSSRYLQISASVERLLGYTAEEVLADPALMRRRMHPDDLPGYLEAAARAYDTMSTLDITLRQQHRDGRWRWVRLLAAPRAAGVGRIVWDGLATDVTEARLAELLRRENEAMLAAVIHSASDAVISTDPQGRISLFNPAAERIFGHEADAVLGQPLDRLLPQGAGARHAAAMAGFAASGATSRRMGAGRVRGRRADGVELELEASISQVTVGERHVLTAILRDVTDRVRNERALLRSQTELTELTHRLMEQEKQTARRLAQVLHDQLGQTLTAMRIDFVAEARLDDPRQAARHARVDRLIDQAVAEVRQLLVELRPTLLDERGLLEALDNELQTRQRAADGVQLRLDAAPGLAARRWPADVEYAAFMVAREALANAQRHAGATRIAVHLDGDARRLRLEVRDDGRGLAADALASRPGHLGMVGMRERAMAIGARFVAGPAAGGGTVVALTWEDPAA